MFVSFRRVNEAREEKKSHPLYRYLGTMYKQACIIKTNIIIGEVRWTYLENMRQKKKKHEKQRHNQIIYERVILGIKDVKTNWFAGFGRGCMSGKDLPFPRPGRMEVLGLDHLTRQHGQT